MKILFLSAWYPNRYDPMPGLFVKQHAEAVAKEHEVSVLYVHAVKKGKWEVAHFVENCVDTTIVYYPSFPTQVLKALYFLKAYWKGFDLVKKRNGRPNLIHVNILTRCGVVGLLIKLVYGIPYVITEHWSRYLPVRNNYKGFLRKWLTQLVVRRSNGIVTVSEAVKTAMQANKLNHPLFEVIYNGVDTDVFIPAGKKEESRTKLFSHISCFDDGAKNISGLVNTIFKLGKTRQDFKLYLVGEGPDKAKIEALSASLGLTGKFIIFTGLLEGKQLVEMYQKSMFTVLFSNYENMPVVIAESFACGIPVIATKAGGIPEVVNETNGVLVEPGNEDELLNALAYMLDNAFGFNTNDIRQFALKNVGKASFLIRYSNFYQKAFQNS